MRIYILALLFFLVSVSCGSNFLIFNSYKSKREKILTDFAKGYIFLSYNETEKGIKYLEEGNKYLKDPSIDLFIARTYLKQGKIDKALDYALKVYKKTKDINVARFILMIYIRKHDFKDLVSFALMAYRDHPNDKVLFHILSLSLDPDKVYKMAQALEFKNPKQAEFFYKLAGDIYKFQGRNKKAAKAYYKVGLIEVFSLNYENAIKFFKKAYNLDPNNIEVINALAYTYLLRDQVKKAEKYVKKLEEKNLKDPSILDTIAYYYYKVGNYKKALELEKEALKLDTSNAILYAHLSLIYYGLGNIEKAKTYAKIALDILNVNIPQALGERKIIKILHKILGIDKKY